ncbi:MAG: peptidyl-prolyl cis-trans isomerase, partial [Rhodoferax sp.]
HRLPRRPYTAGQMHPTYNPADTAALAASAAGEAAPQRARWLREPLLHFVLLGALIFAAHALWGQGAARARIEVTRADQQRLRAQAVQQWGRVPEAAQMAELVEQWVREEVLYREALASGLDQDDMVVRRRLVQKMEFLVPVDLPAPDESALQDYFAAHRAQYAAVATLDLEQVYFAPGAGAKATRALQALRRGQRVAGDNFMLGRTLQGQTRALLARDFGAPWADAVWALPAHRWEGPLQSAHGLHLVRVLDHPGPAPTSLEQVRERVRTDLQNARLAQARDAAYATLRQRYQVVVHASDTP